MEILGYILLKTIDAFSGIRFSKPLVIKPAWLVKEPNAKFNNYVILYPIASTSKNAMFGGGKTLQHERIRFDIRTDNPKDFQRISRVILDSFNEPCGITIDLRSSSLEIEYNDIVSIADYTETITYLTLADDTYGISVGDVITVPYSDGSKRNMYVWRVNDTNITLLGFDGIIYFCQVVGEENLTDKRRGIYRRLIDVEVRAII